MLQRAQSPWRLDLSSSTGLVVAKRRSRLADCGELQFPISYDFLRSKVTGVVAVGNAESQFFREEAQGAREFTMIAGETGETKGRGQREDDFGLRNADCGFKKNKMGDGA